MVSLVQLIERDFPKNNKPMIHLNQKINQTVSDIADLFINFDEYYSFNSSVSTESIFLLDTCSFLNKNITEYDREKKYIITCGVFLEIIQGSTNSTMEKGIFERDLKKLTDLHEYLGSNLIFLFLGRKRRAYWTGYQPSKSCRKCANNHIPHNKILRDIDTELHRLAIILKCRIDTSDYILQNRYHKHQIIYASK
jgi:hypothetical protein